jgi:tripartite-type tricarboxylate transporter receptor subunit TctC
MQRRAFLQGAAASVLAAPALAQSFPDRPIRLVIPYAPGGGTDATMRVLVGPMGEILGQSFVVENRTGGAGSIGAGIVAQARPDGYTLLADPSAHALNHYLLRSLPFAYERDFAPIARMSVMPLVMVVPAAERAPDLAAYIAWAKAGQANEPGGGGEALVGHHGVEVIEVVQIVRRFGRELSGCGDRLSP